MVADKAIEPATPNRLSTQVFVLTGVLADLFDQLALDETIVPSTSNSAVEFRLVASRIVPDLQFAGLALKSDIAAGENLARLFLARLRDSERYKADLEAARAELVERF